MGIISSMLLAFKTSCTIGAGPNRAILPPRRFSACAGMTIERSPIEPRNETLLRSSRRNLLLPARTFMRRSMALAPWISRRPSRLTRVMSPSIDSVEIVIDSFLPDQYQMQFGCGGRLRLSYALVVNHLLHSHRSRALDRLGATSLCRWRPIA